MPAPRPPHLILTAGDPAGIGPELCLMVATDAWPAAITVAGNAALLRTLSRRLGLDVQVRQRAPGAPALSHEAGCLDVIDIPLPAAVTVGTPDSANAGAILASLDMAVDGCLDGRFDAMVTAPLAKSVISDAGVAFTGHTEYLAQRTGARLPVMLLCADRLRVALATTHLPLKQVSSAITATRLRSVIEVLHADLKTRFAIPSPRIAVCGLNPHAGEGGYLGREEIDIIAPLLDSLRQQGLRLNGPLPADTAFTPRVLDQCDAVLAMYHDQGLPALKYASFGHAVNVTLGLRIVRTSVDHGTAFDLAGSGTADPGSLRAAMRLALEMVARGAKLQ